MSDIPTADQKLAEAQRWMDLLPPPPRPLGDQDEISIGAWLREVGEVGGLAGLNWAYRAENWPFGPVMRGRCQHLHGMIFRELEDRGRYQVEMEAAKRRNQDDAAAHELRRSKGWAP